MKILITGAHLTPAVAVVEELNKNKNVQIVYVGRKTTREGDATPSIESQVLPTKGVKFIPIITGRLQRSFTIYTIPSLLKIPIGFIQAFFILLFEKPDVILSFGGYVAVPLVFWSWLLSIPVIIHEQTLVSGLSNRLSSLFASRIAVSFDQNINKFDSSKTVLTGNPLRKNILNLIDNVDKDFRNVLGTAKKENLPVVLITGGNQGSHVINQTVEDGLDQLIKIACIIHQTGDSKFADFERLTSLQNDRYLVKKWISDEMGAILKMCDFVVCRAGANTLTELAYFGKPTLVIPIPYIYQDEQNVNARYFEKLGLVQILFQSDLSKDSLINKIKYMIKNIDYLKKKAQEAKKVVIPDAAKRLALETILLAERYKEKI